MRYLNQPLQYTLFLSLFASWAAVAVLLFCGHLISKTVLSLVIAALLCIALYAYRKAVTLAKRIAAKGSDALCYKRTVDAVQAKVMLVDDLGVIRYYNNALYKWFRQQETAIEKKISGFAASNLSGSRFVNLFDDADNLRTVLKTLASPLLLTQDFAGTLMTLQFIPLIDIEENRLGVAIEWRLAEQTPALPKVRLNEKKLKENFKGFSEVLLQTQTMHATAEKLNAHLKEPTPKFFEMAKTLFTLAQESEVSKQMIAQLIVGAADR